MIAWDPWIRGCVAFGFGRFALGDSGTMKTNLEILGCPERSLPYRRSRKNANPSFFTLVAFFIIFVENVWKRYA